MKRWDRRLGWYYETKHRWDPKGNDINRLLWGAAMHGLCYRFGAEENVLVVHLLEPVIALVVSPVDEHRAVID
jgi:hypothetical protein